MTPPRGDALVLFGATGDLAYKKLFPALYQLEARGRLDVPVIGVARAGWHLEKLQERARSSIQAGVKDPDPAAIARLLAQLRFVDGDYADAGTFQRLRTVLGEAKRPVHYLAVPPGLFGEVVLGLSASGCTHGARVVVEKPFGRDRASAAALDEVLHQAFPESAVFRIDHFMGKEAVQNLLVFRFANTFLEPVWNRDHVKSIEITMAEAFGVEGRGSFYDGVGAIRDVVQNHLLQVVSLLLMEPPRSAEAEAIRDEQVKALRTIRPLTGASLVRGQYAGYLDEPGVAAGSTVETYAAMCLHVDSWRWAGVPVLIRTGKALPLTATEVRVQLHDPPLWIFDHGSGPRDGNYLRFRLGPDVAIGLGALAKRAGETLDGEAVELSVRHQEPGEMLAYERLIGDALDGDQALFGRQDGVEASWRIIDPVLGLKTPVRPYARGSWGPGEADGLMHGLGGWHDPVAT